MSVLLPFLLAGLRTSHPDFDARPFLTAEGARLVDLAATATLVGLFRAIDGLTNDEMGSTDFSYRPGVAPILRACRVPVARMDRPVFVTAGTADDVVPVEVVDQFAADLAAAGNTVRYRRFAGASHVDVLGTGHDELLAWTGEPATSPLDADGDGRVTLDEYDVFALRLAQAFGKSPGSPAAVAVRDGYRALWQAAATRSSTTQFEQEIRPLAESVIALADTDRDGRVSAEELIRVVRDYCLDPAPNKPGRWLFVRV